MSLLLTALVSFFGIITGKIIFLRWINHLTLYSFIMGGLIFFYELKLLPYPDIIPLAWFFIICSFLSYVSGILTIKASQKIFNNEVKKFPELDLELNLFADGGKVVKYTIIICSFIGLIAAIQRWIVLINIFGSIPEVLINAYTVYSFKVRKEEILTEFVPILPQFIYVAIFFSGIYAAYKGRFSFLSLFPFLVIIIKQFTDFGRAELLFTLMEFLFAFFLFRNLLITDKRNRFKFSAKNAALVSSLLIIMLIATASFIRITRGTYENYRGASKELKQLNENLIISPSIYLYFSSDVGVFSKYLESDGEDTYFGENTLKGFYFFLARLGILEKPNFFQKGYFIPMWTNTGTFLRELHADFGTFGVISIPYILGLTITWLWYNFYRRKKIYLLAFLVYFYIVIGFSFLMMITRLNQWFLSLFLIIVITPILEKLALKKKPILLNN